MAAIAATALAAWAGIVALGTLRDQQQINRSQLWLNELAEQRQQQRYASRVVYWWDGNPAVGKALSALVIQNRSPVPIRFVRFAFKASFRDNLQAVETVSVTAAPGDLPPCAVRTYRLTEPKFTDVAASVVILPYEEQLEFTDSVGRWMRNTTGIRALEPTEPALDPTLPLQEDVKQRSEAEDCGEGG
ncbi:hypothetical protein [Micromonospora sp. NPDC049891]|uniref:hypothetical protein n=1 Tax=Micromonospora sp. NPDC049891 TaxID=3155655 RepID=UPI0033F18514